MRLQEKILSRKLRKKGHSIREICKKTGFAKGSVSVWVRDIALTTEQKQILSEKGTKKEVIEKRRITRITKENVRRQFIVDQAETNIKSLSKKDLFIIGITLYWAEGRKAGRGIVSFSNSDPRAIKLMMRFFKEICKVPKEKFRGHIHIHPHLDYKKAEKYWSDISNIPLPQLYKTYRIPNKSSQNKKDTLPYGTFDIYICNTELFLKIKGWINGVCKSLKV
jgi:hypothetical protein